MELKTKSHVFYDMSVQRPTVQERTCEVIVSDAQPDILRICGVTGQLFGTGPSLAGNGAEFRPVLRAAVLYLPEDGDGICSIPVRTELPFRLELGDAAGEESLFGSAVLVSLDARVINPRKVLVRAEAAYQACRVCPAELALPVAAEAAGVELLTESWEPRLLCAAGKRAFTVDDSFPLPASAPALREVLCAKTDFTAGEYNVIGRRVVFKGALTLTLLYRTVAAETAETSISFPFSQIAELEGLEEDAECVITLLPTSAEVTAAPDGDGRMLEFSAGCEAQITAYAHRHLEAITDLYATGQMAAADHSRCGFRSLVRRMHLSTTVRDTAETSGPVREVRSAEVFLRPLRLSVTPEGDARLSGEAEVRLSCTDETGEPGLLRRRTPVSLELGAVEPGELSVLTETRAENIAASPAAGSGVELRFDLSCGVSLFLQNEIDCVTAARLEPFPADAPPQPSVVLRAPGPGETLWSVAKRCGSTVRDLAAANGLETAAPDDPAPAGRVLLIPKSR